MNLSVTTEVGFDIVKLTLTVACAYLAINAYARHSPRDWLLALTAKRMRLLALLILIVIGIKVFEDVIARESSAVDTALLWFIRQHMPAEMTGFFEIVTWTGAGIVLAPLALVLSAGLWLAHRRHEAVVLAASMASAWLFIYAIKSLVERSRPSLWSAAWYWGSSFPSGHTVNTAAFAGTLAIVVARIWPRWRSSALTLAAIWIGLVALSRLVLGVHWPTDVLAAICLGFVIPLVMSVLIDLRKPDWVIVNAA